MLRQLGYAQKGSRRHLSSQTIDDWIASPKHAIMLDTLYPERLTDLYITLPTRDGVRKQPFLWPKRSQPLGYGHHMAFFHKHIPESHLRADATDGDFGPPEPFTRRMWAGGKMTWNTENPLLIGEKVEATSWINSVEKKGFEKGNPMVFVDNKIEYSMIGKPEPSVVEERTHVYFSSPQQRRGPREVKSIPATKDILFKYTPTLTTLFRFSAITWNAHHIHLDKDYAVNHEGYPERLVHGPLTALMLLETLVYHFPRARLMQFDYRAQNPLIVGRPLVINGHQLDRDTFFLWCEDELDGTVGMTGQVQVQLP
ncbi:hypothetical protein L218DRAFT_923616 [Marasmius fiardii PR-910]|nr:hypothetical protein L218DRAFT_923616 [Marasmius fiardii PR-910]